MCLKRSLGVTFQLASRHVPYDQIVPVRCIIFSKPGPESCKIVSAEFLNLTLDFFQFGHRQ